MVSSVTENRTSLSFEIDDLTGGTVTVRRWIDQDVCTVLFLTHLNYFNGAWKSPYLTWEPPFSPHTILNFIGMDMILSWT